MNRQILKYIVLAGLFAIPFIPFLVSGSLFFPFITTKAYAFRIVVEVIFAAWVLLALADPAYRPRKSYMTYALFAFLLIVGAADLFGAAPMKSFWSNSERMEGYITLLHLGALYLVMRNTLRDADWTRWWKTSLGASVLMFVYCVFQLLGALEIHQGGARVDGTLGNAAYLAVYMLFHVFIALYLLVRSRGAARVAYGAIALLDAVILYYTATRGAILGLLGGLLIASLLSLRNREQPRVRTMAMGYLAAFVLIVVGFFALRGTSFVQSSPVLMRFASISSSELKSEGRSFVWPMALKGIKDHPLLGWGQDNFNYVFNTYYSPEMYRLEPWFDRAHNIFLDWGIQAGILGLVAYLALYYMLMRAVWRSRRFSLSDKSLITGLTAAYFFHNIFVFDNLISYILFISLLAFADGHDEAPVLAESRLVSERAVASIALPVAVLALLVALYYVNVKPMQANTTLIDALQSQSSNPSAAIAAYEKAYATARLGRPEVVEQIAANAPQILGSSISMEDKNAFFAFAKSVVEAQAAELPTDARYQLLAGTFLENTGQFDEALTYLEKARELTPGKQMVYYELAGAYINKNEYQKGLATLKSVYDLDHENTDAEIAYLVGAIYAGDRGVEASLIADLTAKSPSLLNDPRIANAYANIGRYGEVVALYAKQLAADPSSVQSYVNLAAAELKAGDKAGAIQTLEKLGTAMPQYKTEADTYIAQIKNGTLK